MESSTSLQTASSQETVGFAQFARKIKIGKKPTAALDYEPFDARDALAQFRAERRSLDPETAREKIEEIKGRVLEQQMGIAALVEDMRRMVLAEQQVEPELLRAIADDAARDFRLPSDDRSSLVEGVEKLIRRNQIVEKYKNMAGESLYELCFGRKPVGKVAVVPGPVSLHLEIENEDDYVHTYYRTPNPQPHSYTDEQKEEALRSQGLAFTELGHPELAGAISVARPAYYEHHQTEAGTETEILTLSVKDDFATLVFDTELRGNITIERGGVVYEISREHDPASKKVRTIIKDITRGDRILYDIELGPDEEFEQCILGEVGDRLFYVHVMDDSLGLREHGSHQSHILFQKARYDQKEEPVFSEDVRLHEEQHLVNKFFLPFEEKRATLQIIRDVMPGSEVTGSPEALRSLKESLFRGLVRAERRGRPYLFGPTNGFETRARDEIIAYYRDGTSLETIQRTLTENPLYDYLKHVEKAIPLVVKEHVDTLRHFLRRGNVSNQTDVSFDDIDTTRIAYEVFREGYHADVASWIAAVSAFEEKGYDKEEIISLLSIAPVTDWSRLARRVRKSSRFI